MLNGKDGTTLHGDRLSVSDKLSWKYITKYYILLLLSLHGWHTLLEVSVLGVFYIA